MSEENQTIIKALNMFGRVPEQYELLNEIERLNNIINELEKYLEEQSTNLNRMSCTGHVYFMYQEDANILDKLKELKESKYEKD